MRSTVVLRAPLSKRAPVFGSASLDGGDNGDTVETAPQTPTSTRDRPRWSRLSAHVRWLTVAAASAVVPALRYRVVVI